MSDQTAPPDLAPAAFDGPSEDSIAVLRDPGEIAGPRNRRLYDWWAQACGAAAMPAYSVFDPVEMRWALGHVSVVEAQPDGDYRYRVDGTVVAEYFRIDMTGKRLSQFPDAKRAARIKESFDLVCRAQAPVYARRFVVAQDFVFHMHFLLLPFSNGARAPGKIMSCLAYGKALDPAPG